MPTSVGTNPSTAYTAAGFSANPTIAGRLNSNAWDIRGFDFGTLGFGGNQTVDDFGRGQITNPVLTGGLYAYTELPGTVANPAFMIQPTATDFNPGAVVLRLRNNGTTNMTQLAVSYNLFLRNDEGRSNSFNFSHSPDDIVYEAETTLDYASPETPDAFQWTQVDVTPSRSIIITGINVAPGGYYYLRWTSQDISGTGDRDEFGLDDIVISATYGPPAAEINVKGVSGVTVLSGDTTPTVAEGTDFAPIGAPISTTSASVNTTFIIQNLGGAILNVSNVTITGTNAADFAVFIPSPTNTPTGDIQPAGSPSNQRELTLKFDPSDEGLRTARVYIANNDSNENPYWFDIQGYGVIPKPDMNVKGLTGGTSNITSGNMIPSAGNNTLWAVDQLVGTSTTKDYRIQNTALISSILLLTGTPKVTISGVNPGDFVVTTQPPATSINGGFGTNFIITFTPSAPGIRTALVTIQNNDPIADPFTTLTESPYTFLVQGKGVAPEIDITGNAQPIVSGSITPTLVNHTIFDYLNINAATLDRVYSIRNTGTMPLTIGAVTLSGVNASEFSIITLPAASLAVNATTTFTVRFDPSSVGVRNAIVSVVSNDYDENPYTFAIRGYGLDYIPCAYSAVETIAIQDFEATPATPTWGISGTGYTLAAGTAYGLSGDGGSSDRFLGARSLQVTNATSTVTFAAVNTTLFSDIELSIRLASMSTTDIEGSDVADKVIVAVSANGGATWSNELDLSGNTNSKWNFVSGSGIASALYDGNNILTNFLTAAGGYVTANGTGTIRLSGLPKTTNLMVRITLINNAAEIWALENVTLFGRKEITTIWNGSAWSNSAPTTTVKAIFSGSYNTATNGNVTACKCQVNAGQTVTVGTNQFLSVESDIENSGSITVESGGSLVQRNDFAANIGNVVVRRNSTAMRMYDYTYWSSPVAGQTLFNLSPLTKSDKFYQFNTPINNWQGVPSGNIMTPSIGYIIRAPQNFTSTPQIYPAQFAGPANNGIYQPAIFNSTGTWNLLGNPYPSAINANAFLQLADNAAILNGTIYLWTHNTPIASLVYNFSDYAVYTLLGGTGTAAAPNVGVNNTIPTGKIASGQGFFVVAHGNGNATFNNSMRLTGNNTEFFRTANQMGMESISEPDGIEKHRIWLDFANADGLFKQTLVGYAEGGTNEFDTMFDGPMPSGGNAVSFYSLMDENTNSFSIQARALPFNNQDKVRLGYSTTVAGNYTIGIEGTDGLFGEQDIYLEDKALNVIHDLKESSYVFTTETGTFNERFELRYTTEQLSTPGFNPVNSLLIAVKESAINLKSSQENISEVTVYDMLGRTIYTRSDIGTTHFSIENLLASQQSLIVKAKLENGAIVTKKILFK